MPGKPFQSQLLPYEDDLFARLAAGRTYRQVAADLEREHGIKVTHNAVFSFVKRRRQKRGGDRLFYDGFSPDIRDALLKQVAACWTHDSTAPTRPHLGQ